MPRKIGHFIKIGQHQAQHRLNLALLVTGRGVLNEMYPAGWFETKLYPAQGYVIISDLKGSPPRKCTSLTEWWFYTISVRCRLEEVRQAVGNRKTLSEVEGAFALI